MCSEQKVDVQLLYVSESGRSDVALSVLLNASFPGYGWMVAGTDNPEPATTLWEEWDTFKEGDIMVRAMKYSRDWLYGGFTARPCILRSCARLFRTHAIILCLRLSERGFTSVS